MKKFCFIFIISVLLIFIGCGGSESENSTGSENEDCATIDGNMWSSMSSETMDWRDAVDYCEDLNECGHTDWHLPNINELRTLIKNCPATQTGGICGVQDPNCLKDPDCFYYSAGQCRCEKTENNSGYYSKLGDDDKVVLCSSSNFEHISGCIATTLVWSVDFSNGQVGHSGESDLGDDSTLYNVRCVR